MNEITVIADNAMRVFVVQDTQEELMQPNSLFYGEEPKIKDLVDSMSPTGSVSSAINCFIVEIGQKMIMFDTGLGIEGGGMLLNRMTKAGITPDSIEAVFITHCHGDHIGGLMTEDKKRVFVNAKVYIPKQEFDYWYGKDSGIEDISKAYGSSLILFDDNTTLPCEVVAHKAAGHTPGHTVYSIGSFIFAGDIMHGIDLQYKNPEISAGYDMDVKKSIESRKRCIEYAISNGKILAGVHFHNGIIK